MGGFQSGGAARRFDGSGAKCGAGGFDEGLQTGNCGADKSVVHLYLSPDEDYGCVEGGISRGKCDTDIVEAESSGNYDSIVIERKTLVDACRHREKCWLYSR